jgi:hypothetical protein
VAFTCAGRLDSGSTGSPEPAPGTEEEDDGGAGSDEVPVRSLAK